MQEFYFKFLALIITSVIMISCGTTQVYYTHNNSVKSALAHKGNPPSSVTHLNTDIDLGNWDLSALSASPDSEYLALGMVKLTSPREDSESKYEIYSSSGGTLEYTYDDEDIKEMIEDNSDGEYPPGVYLFYPIAFGYENDSILIMHIQPHYLGESLPQDVRLKINLRTNEVVGNAEFFSRTNRPPFPTHASKTKYNFEVINGKMYVNGTRLQGMPSGIGELHDEVTLDD